MSDRQAVSLRNRWFITSVGVVAGLAFASAVVGFIWLPALQGELRQQSLWDVICSAAGLIRPPATEPVVQPGYATTRVIVTQHMMAGADAESIGRGATLALRCTMCHGARGLSDANSPNLAGQYAVAVYKELLDFKSGARASAVMAPLVANLSDQDMRDLAAYYAFLPRVPANYPATEGAPPIVIAGAPMRNIAPCGACHGKLDEKPGSPWLEGQPIAYLQAQLQAFASEARRNDISEQMRNVARNMTAAEIDAAARYYGNQP